MGHATHKHRGLRAQLAIARLLVVASLLFSSGVAALIADGGGVVEPERRGRLALSLFALSVTCGGGALAALGRSGLE